MSAQQNLFDDLYGEWEIYWRMSEAGDRVFRSGPIGPVYEDGEFVSSGRHRAEAEASRLRNLVGIEVVGVFLTAAAPTGVLQ